MATAAKMTKKELGKIPLVNNNKKEIHSAINPCQKEEKKVATMIKSTSAFRANIRNTSLSSSTRKIFYFLYRDTIFSI